MREGLAQILTRSTLRHQSAEASGRNRCAIATAETIAFKLAPRLNAAGRLDHAILGVQLLTTESPAEAQRLADRLDQLNRERQKIEAELMAEAVKAVNEEELPAALVLASRQWHRGRCRHRGSAFGRTVSPAGDCDRDQRQGIGKGSARTIGSFDLYQGLAACRDLLEAFGGHPSAAGVTVTSHDWMSSVSVCCGGGAVDRGAATVPTLHVDAEVRLSEVNRQAHRTKSDRCIRSARAIRSRPSPSQGLK